MPVMGLIFGAAWVDALFHGETQAVTEDLIRFACPSCKKNLRVPMKLAGQRGRCPKCRSKIDVPKPDTDLPILAAAGDTAEVEKLRPASQEVRPASRRAQPASGPRPSSRRARKRAGWSVGKILGVTAGLGCVVMLLVVLIGTMKAADVPSQSKGDDDKRGKPTSSPTPADVRARELAYVKLLIERAGYELVRDQKADGEAASGGSGMVEAHVLQASKDDTLYVTTVAAYTDLARARRQGWDHIKKREAAFLVGQSVVTNYIADHYEDLERLPLQDLEAAHARSKEKAPFHLVFPTKPASTGKPPAKKKPPIKKKPVKATQPKPTGVDQLSSPPKLVFDAAKRARKLNQIARSIPHFDPAPLLKVPTKLRRINWQSRVNKISRAIRSQCTKARRQFWPDILKGIVDYMSGRRSRPPADGNWNGALGLTAREKRVAKKFDALLSDFHADQYRKALPRQLQRWRGEWSKARKGFIDWATGHFDPRATDLFQQRPHMVPKRPFVKTWMNTEIIRLKTTLVKARTNGMTLDTAKFNKFLASIKNIVGRWNQGVQAGYSERAVAVAKFTKAYTVWEQQAVKLAGGRIRVHARIWPPTDPPYLVIKNLNRFRLTDCVVTLNGTHTYWPNKPKIRVGGKASMRLDYFRNRQGRAFWPVGTITRIEVRSNQGVWHGELGR